MSPEKANAISRWKVTGAFHNPNNITVNLLWPHGVRNPIFVGLPLRQVLDDSHLQNVERQIYRWFSVEN